MKAHDSFHLYGTAHSEPPSRQLTAARMSVELIGANLRSIRHDGTEVLRGIAYLVRDADWGTIEPVLSDFAVEDLAGGFLVTCTAQYSGPGETRLDVTTTITGRSDGTLVFAATADSDTGFETNRCGFCILHPIVGLAGAPVTVEHCDGTIVETVLPDLIDPWQPFMEMRAITHTVREGVTARCLMEGDAFEMEDQRNWSDASYKTYVRPLALPWPYTIESDEPVRQRITLTMADAGQGRSLPRRAMTEQLGPERSGPQPAVTLSPGSRTGTMPNIGLIVTQEEAAATAAIFAAGRAPPAQDLIFHFDPLAGHGQDALAGFARVAGLHAGTTTLEIALPCVRPPDVELDEIADMARAAGLRPDAVMVSPSVDRQSTPPGSDWPACPDLETVYAAALGAFPGTRLGGGMLSYFTELNRKRVPAGQLAFISHATCPIVHAADDESVMQTLEALPFITRSVRAIYGDMPYRIGPSTIAMRQNPYGSRTMDNPGDERIPMAATDPRHTAAFGAAFALGYAIRVSDADLEQITLSAMTGSFGLFAGRNEPSNEGAARPLHAVIALLSSLAGTLWTDCVSSDPARLLALVVKATETWCLVVNLTARSQAFALDDGLGRVIRSELLQDGAFRKTSRAALPAFSVARLLIGQ